MLEEDVLFREERKDVLLVGMKGAVLVGMKDALLVVKEESVLVGMKDVLQVEKDDSLLLVYMLLGVQGLLRRVVAVYDDLKVSSVLLF
ncbi:hypothetical protein PR003_g6055 [Phytophthora rubi]|uniref:Uncharacterized protein n=1 Tax=Phytophthora rubi TaxID=129364 RepID=A0A6A3MUV0_9STRA|nr:hypothetical protein PR002_g28568 [Phytophthora rubi]KAE9032603.1 hypothetical protein PR001_g10538 [Phytophthora rubi]KAE9349118.1 hypothetical protein PR003_g6055 [Phytophthora rubi]